MLAYAASAPRFAERRSSPNALLAIIAAHVALLAVVMSAKRDLPRRLVHGPLIIVVPVPTPPPPPAPVPRPNPRPHSGPTAIPLPLPMPPMPGPDALPNPTASGSGPIAGSGPITNPVPLSVPVPIRVGPEIITPLGELRPPYPPSKLLTEEEATLKLRLSIDERGRVVAVDPIGRADSIFLAAARRHLLAHWRFKPASEDGRAVTSTTVITLRFQLDG